MEKLHVTLNDEERQFLINNAKNDDLRGSNLLYNKLVAICQHEHYIRMDMNQQAIHIDEMGCSGLIFPTENETLMVDWDELSPEEIPCDNQYHISHMVGGRRDTLQLQRCANNVYLRYILHLGSTEVYAVKWNENDQEKTVKIVMEDCDVLAFDPGDKIMISSNPCQHLDNRYRLRPSDYERINYVIDMYDDQPDDEFLAEILNDMENKEINEDTES